MERRNYGMIERLPSGLWRARVRRSGQVVQLGASVGTEAEAEALLRQYAASTGSVPSAVSLSAWGEQAIADRDRRGTRSDGRELSAWRLYVGQDPIGGLAVRALRRPDVVQWLARMERRGISPRTVERALSLLRVVIQRALDQFGLEANPARDVEVSPSLYATDEEDLGGVLLPEEQQALLRVVPARWLPYVRFALYTGCREGEQWELRWPDVELARGRITLRRSRMARPTKGGRPRVIVCPPPVLADLRTMRERWMEAEAEWKLHPKGRFRDADSYPDYVFPGARGDKHVARGPEGWHDWVRAADISRPWHVERACKPQDPEGPPSRRKPRHAPASAIRWHDLRHTCATSLLAGWWGRKWAIEEVKAYLAHQSVQVTERYARYVDSLASDAVAGTAWAITPRP